MTDKPLWKRALSVAADFEDDAASKPTQPAASPTAVTAVASSAVPATGFVPATPADPVLLETLMKAALSRKTVFSGLLDAAERLKAVLPDETQRIKAAAALSGTVTADSINAAVAGHLQDVQSERTKFNREVDAAMTAKIDGPNAQAAQLESQVASSQAEIERLTAGIAQLTSQATAFREQASAASADLTNTIGLFEAAATNVEQRLTTLRDAVISALK